MTPILRRRRGRTHAFTIIEVALALIVFLMMTLMFAAVFPTAMRAGEISNRYAQASLLAQHKLNQLRQAGYSKLDYTHLSGLGFVDTMASPPTSYPCILSFTQVEDLVPNSNGKGYFPSGTVGTITISNYESTTAPTSTTLPVNTPPLAGSNTNISASNMMLVTVSIIWPGQGGAGGSYTTSTMIVSSH
jgi:type II secretory pathway pseudopilin PulG